MSESGEQKILRNIYRAVYSCALFTVAVCAVSLAGWLTHRQALLSAWHSGVPMRFNAALCMGLLGVSLALLLSRNPAARIAARVCGALVLLVALATLSEHLFGWNLHIDQALWIDTVSVVNPGRMARVTSIYLSLAAMAVLTLQCRQRTLNWYAQAGVVFASLAAQWGILDVLFRHEAQNRIALNSACVLIVLSLGLLLVPNSSGFLQPIARDTSGGRFLRRMIPTMVIAPLLVGWIRWESASANQLDLASGIAVMVTTLTSALLLVSVWTANSSDRTDRERQRLQAELNSFFSLPIHSLLAIIRFDGHFKMISSSWEKILGISEEEILRTPYLELVHPDDREATSRCAQEIAAGNPVAGFQNRYRTADGSYRWLAWNVMPGSNDLMYAIAEDITDNKRMEAELRENAERSRMLIEGLQGTALYMIDPQAHIMTWNAGAEQMTGYTAEEAIGKPASFLYSHDITEKITPEYLREVAAGRDRREVEKWRVRKDGSQFLCEAFVSELKDAHGATVGFVKLVRDITERVAVEQKIRRLNEELEERVKERTAELASSNRELEAFAYSVSHDLRAPLRHLDGFLALLRRRAYAQLDESAKHYVDATMDASRRMGTLIDELLQFSRLGRSSLHSARVDLNNVILEVRHELQADAARRVIRWEIGNLPPVVADRSMVRQVVFNLLANALKFTRTRAEAVIRVEGILSHGEVEVIVSDNGVGFDMQYYNKLFGVFQRLHSEDEFEGTGIGLANVRRIVERHGGRVWANSEPGQGATFYFTLTASPEQVKETAFLGEAGETNAKIETHIAG